VLAGIDPSTKKIAIVGASLSGRKAWHEAISIAERGETAYTPERAARAADAVEQVLLTHKVQEVWLEAPLLGRAGVRTAVTLGYVAGAVQVGAVRAGAEVHLVNVQKWKSTVCGARFGSASKSDVAKAMAKLWPVVYRKIDKDQDLIDASAICWHGLVVRGNE